MPLNSGPESTDVGLSKVLPAAKPAVAPIAQLRAVCPAAGSSPIASRRFERIRERRHKIATVIWCGLERRTTVPAVRSKGAPSMCDYSLDYVASRPAKVGDKLVTRTFA